MRCNDCGKRDEKSNNNGYVLDYDMEELKRKHDEMRRPRT